MGKYIKNISKKAGLPPGTLVHIGDKKGERVRISMIDYTKDRVKDKILKRIEECYPYKRKKSVTWINIDGLHDVKTIEKLGKEFKLHHLLLEDILNTGQRPKMEDFEDYFLFVTKMLRLNDDSRIEAEQISIVLGRDYVVSFQERTGDVFDSIRERITERKGRIRDMGADYLAYTLLDSIVDNYYQILEKVGERIERMEEVLLEKSSPATLEEIHKLRRVLIMLRKAIWPLRDVVNGFLREESPLIKDSTKVYLRDVYDHTIQVMDTIATYRDMLRGMLDVYLSTVSNKMNEVMKVLTIIATIFIPLTFIAGIYGMNFAHMPELGWRWAYPAVMLLMVIMVVIMLGYFRKKRWI